MLLAKDQNTVSAPNFLHISKKRNSDSSHNREARKPILKKNATPIINGQVQKHSNKQHVFINIKNIHNQQVDEEISYISSENMKRIKNKKKSIFLQLDQLHNSQKKKNRSNLKKISFRSVGSQQSQIKSYHSNYKQSKVNIIFSNSNISEFFGIPEQDVDFDLPEKSYQNLKSSEVVQIKIPNQQSMKLSFKKTQKYEVKKSDRIIEDSQSNRDSKNCKLKTFDNTLSTNPSPFSTNSSDFKQSQFYQQQFQVTQEGECFTIKQTPPNISQNSSFQQQNIIRTLVGSRSQFKLTKNQQLCKIKIQQARKRLLQSINEDNSQHSEDLLVTFSSKVLSKNKMGSYIQLQEDYKERFIEKINLYRFLNRLIFKIGKYLDFANNKKQLRQLIVEMIKIKCFILLNAEIQIQNESPRKSCLSDENLILKIIQNYTQKEKQHSYWSSIWQDFQKNSFIEYSLNKIIFNFMKATIAPIESSLIEQSSKLRANIRTKDTLLIQLRLKILKYLFYDIYKLNLLQDKKQTLCEKKSPLIKKRLIKIIQRNQWNQKIPLEQVQKQYKQLKKELISVL